MSHRPTYVFVGVYRGEADARADYEIVKDLHGAGAVSYYDAAVITRDDEGRVHVSKDETATRNSAWAGAGVGAVVGMIFPPAMLAAGAVGAGLGALTGHLWRGASRGKMKDLGEALDDGEASLVVVSDARVADMMRKNLQRATRTIEMDLDADAEETRQQLAAARDA